MWRLIGDAEIVGGKLRQLRHSVQLQPSSPTNGSSFVLLMSSATYISEVSASHATVQLDTEV